MGILTSSGAGAEKTTTCPGGSATTGSRSSDTRQISPGTCTRCTVTFIGGIGTVKVLLPHHAGNRRPGTRNFGNTAN